MKLYRKNIAILCTMDAYANSVRPLEIKKFLTGLGHKVIIIDDTKIYKKNGDKLSSGTYKNGSNKLQHSVYRQAIILFDNYVNGWFYYYYFLLKLNIRSKLLLGLIKKHKIDVLIIENNIQAYVTRSEINIPYILDLDSPLIDELYFTGKLNKTTYEKLIIEYKKIYSKARFLNFQWHLYKKYTQQNVYAGKNLIEINYGCTPKKPSLRAKYSIKPKIICLGYLGGKWVNLPLLSKLSRLHEIDVYGGPVPDKKWGLNYKGYAPSTDVIKDYQFGLITITKDKLRRSSFSSKHLEYLSYGLPVLTPVWRKDSLLKDVSIYYDEDNFLEVIKKYSDRKKWNKMSNTCYKRANEWKWEKVLEPFANILEKIG